MTAIAICRVRTAIKRLDKERDRNPPAFFLAPAFFPIDNQTRAIKGMNNDCDSYM